ncbi:hypothetical protein Sulac_2092 [Sulfobacillus acidophilus DSM 10332]|uniref:Glycosyltransferase RgtA/B/C/D-like domain-containing protein n=1 Tax=Sulfobacillus acidophilus (strain ATCC 700253 / DSM 10332 / NAL) TaxID=679936 RepID=G8TSW3_SULAD|nr:hypothetical protein Sulac_2092 [Sulfobacillus acidophilus DSM 10332]
MSTTRHYSSISRSYPVVTRVPRPYDRNEQREALGAGLFTFILSLVAAAVLVFKYHTMQNDALGRVMDAYYVIYHQFHLAAIGFVWNPLPSLLELPLVAFERWWHPLVTDAFAGSIVSSLFAGIGAYYLIRIMQHWHISRWFRGLWALIYVLNPMIFLFEPNGMSDIMMVTTFLAALDGLLRYIATENIGQLVSSSIWLGLAFLNRYEAVPFALCIGVAWDIGMIVHGVPWKKIIGRTAILALPITYLGFLWIFFNWTIMGDPFYFANSEYSNAAQMKTGIYNFWVTALAKHSIPGTAHILIFFANLFPPFIPAFILVVVVALVKKLDTEALILLAASVAVPLLQADLLFKGLSAAWDRYFIMYIPMGFLLIFYLVHVLKGRRWQTWVLSGLATIALLVGDAQTLSAIQKPGTGHGLRPLVAYLLHPNRPNSGALARATVIDTGNTAMAKEEADYINRHPHIRVLLDTFNFFFVIPYVDRPSQVVITNDADFRSVLQNPRGRITDILVPQPVGISQLNMVNVVYPTLWSGGVPWTRLVASFGSDRLYQVLSNAP